MSPMCAVEFHLLTCLALCQGFDGPLPTKLEDLTLDSAQITFRKVRGMHSSPAAT